MPDQVAWADNLLGKDLRVLCPTVTTSKTNRDVRLRNHRRVWLVTLPIRPHATSRGGFPAPMPLLPRLLSASKMNSSAAIAGNAINLGITITEQRLPQKNILNVIMFNVYKHEVNGAFASAENGVKMEGVPKTKIVLRVRRPSEQMPQIRMRRSILILLNYYY